MTDTRVPPGTGSGLLLLSVGLAVCVPEYLLLARPADHDAWVKGLAFAVGLHVLRVAIFLVTRSHPVLDRVMGRTVDHGAFHLRLTSFLLMSGAMGTLILCVCINAFGTMPPMLAVMLVAFDAIGLAGVLLSEAVSSRMR